ncbi:MAG: Asp-tRNA(Asn)/Glu-tRNA(Gln) amidotransferase subunit GatC [Thermodesulfovibrionia bacterium]
MIDIEHIALLARLGLTDEEKEVFGRQLGSIIGYIGKLNQLNTSDVEPTSHVIEMRNVFREDRIEASLDMDEAMENAPSKKGGFYKVPRIIE